MITTFFKSVALSLILLAAISLLFSAKAEEDTSSNCSYKVGVVPQFEQRRIFAVWTPILEMINQKTGCEFHLIGSKSIIEFERAFKEGVYDFAYMNPYHAVMAKKAQGYKPLVRSGTKKLKGILVVKKDSTVTDLEALTGKKVAFPSPNALGASLLMRAELANKHNSHPEAMYVKTHSSVYLHVAKGLALAGGGVGRTLEEQPDFIKNSLKVIYTTTPVYAHPFVAHPRVGIEMQKNIQDIWVKEAVSGTDLFNGIPMKEALAISYNDYIDLENLGLENFLGNED